MAQQVPLHDRNAAWLLGLVRAIESVSQPALHAMPCDPALLAAAEQYLARPCAIDRPAPHAQVRVEARSEFIRPRAETADDDGARSHAAEFLHA